MKAKPKTKKFPRLNNYPQDATKEELVAYVEKLTDWAVEAEEELENYCVGCGDPAD